MQQRLERLPPTPFPRAQNLRNNHKEWSSVIDSATADTGEDGILVLLPVCAIAISGRHAQHLEREDEGLEPAIGGF